MITLALIGTFWLGSFVGLALFAPGLLSRAFHAILDEVSR